MIKMASYLICLTSGSGIPVYTRSIGNVKPLPFPVIGSLNAVHMFAANHDAVLKSTTTEDAKIIWKEFENSLVLILVQGRDTGMECDGGGEQEEDEGGGGGEGGSDVGVVDASRRPPGGGRLLHLVWDAMVLLYGKEDLVNIRNVERFKREIKVCFQLVDSLLLQATSPLFSDITAAVDVAMVNESPVLQTFIEAFAGAAESPYGCLLIGGRVVAATERWWSLKASELALLSRLIASMASCSARDVPVYLPYGSPTIPHRLLTFELLYDVTACVICGPNPSLFDLEKEIGHFWISAVDTLKSARQTIPRNIPSSLDLDANILGFILINTSLHRCLNSVSVMRDGRSQGSQEEEQVRLEKRRAVLRSFFAMVVGTYFGTAWKTRGASDELSHQPTDTYIVCSGHKCYAHATGPYQIFVLFAAKTPTFAMRSVTQKTLNLLVKDKNCPL